MAGADEPSQDQMAEIIVSVDDAHLEDLPRVVESLQAAGMQVTDTMAALGTVAGAAPASLRQALERVEGVAAVEVSRGVRIAPPDADVQ